MAGRPTLGVFKLTSCDGCQLTLLSLEDELLDLVSAVDITHFPEMTSNLGPSGPFDVALVEGSVSTREQVELVAEVRARAKTLVTIGACATAGGIQALRNFGDHQAFASAVYARPDLLDSLATSTPVADHVRVDFELRGCPISKAQLLELLSSSLVGRKPQLPRSSVCMECKAAGRVCVVVSQGIPCLGPVTAAGCGSICPGMSRGCYGCFGASSQANTRALAESLRVLGRDRPQVRDAFRFINAWDPTFKTEGDRHDG